MTDISDNTVISDEFPKDSSCPIKGLHVLIYMTGLSLKPIILYVRSLLWLCGQLICLNVMCEVQCIRSVDSYFIPPEKQFYIFPYFHFLMFSNFPSIQSRNKKYLAQKCDTSIWSSPTSPTLSTIC